ncbi:competence CoiA-like predicted nuclease [Anaerotaenia torta]|uniref:competence protein CoiA family protein n=1 Tax=Anaerotaenia torta TaxID=433293 RepID=UPI003D19F9DA
MENCLYHGKLVCTYDLKDEDGLYYEELVLEWKEAAARGGLHCIECGKRVYLAAGPVKEPYFAHYDLEECDYGKGQESEELKRGKRLLYHLAKRSFPEGSVLARHRMDNGMYSSVFCSGTGYAVALDYRLVNNSLEKYRIRDDYYHGQGIHPVYIMGKRQQKDTKQLDWYQNLVQNSMGYLIFLDAADEVLTLKKCYGYRIGKERRFKYQLQSYPIRELLLDTRGQLICDFAEKGFEIERQIEEEKRIHQKREEQLKRLREEERLKEEQRKEAWLKEKWRKEEEPSVKIKDLNRLSREEILSRGLNPDIYARCIAMIERGEGHLVAKKYFDIITA